MKLSPQLAFLLALCSVQGLTYAQTSYTESTSTDAWNTSRWNNDSDADPYDSAFTENNHVWFTSGTYSFVGGMGDLVQVGNITLDSNTTVTFSQVTGVLGTGGAVSTIDVGTGSRLDLSNQEIDADANTGFIKNGAGVLLLGSSSTPAYGGGFTLNAGAVVSRGVNSFGQGATNVLTLNGGILASDGSRSFDSTYFEGGIVVGGNVQIGALNTVVTGANNTAAMSFANNMSLGTGNRTFTVGNNAAHTFGGIISNTSGGITFSAAPDATGSFNITNLANTFTGDVTITGGRVNFSGDGSLGNSSNNVIIDGGVFSTASNSSYTIASSRTLYLGDHANSAINTATGRTLTVSSGLVNKTGETGNLVKQGAGTLSLVGANTYSGSTTISGGILRLFGSSSLSAGNYSQTISIASGARFRYDSSAAQNLSGVISGAGNVDIVSGTLTLSGANTLTGTYTVSNGGVLSLASNSALGTSSKLTLNSGAVIDNATNNNISISNGAKSITDSLTYLGTGNRTLTLGGTGATTLNIVDSAAAEFNVVSGELAFTSNTTASGISLEKWGNGTLSFTNLANNALTGITNINEGTLRIVRNASLGDDITFDVKAGASLSLDGNLSWTGSYILNNNSQLIRQTTSVISANAVYAANRTLTSADGLTNGQHTINSGVTITATSDLFGSTPSSAVEDRIVMEDASSIRSTGTYSINGNKGIMLQGAATIGASSGQTLTINSAISGGESGALTIGGTNANGVVALNGVNAYLGTTTVSSGTLLINGSIGSTQSVTVASGAAIGGSGSIAGSLHLNNGALLHIGSLGQSLSVAGAITFGGTFGIANLTGINWSTIDNGTYTLISTSQTFNGQVANFGIENAYSLGNGRSAYFQNGSLAMVVVPEPSVAILTGLGACALLRRRRSAS